MGARKDNTEKIKLKMTTIINTTIIPQSHPGI